MSARNAAGAESGVSDRPRVVLHLAVSLDGKCTGFQVDVGRFYALAATWREDATLVGTDTLLAATEQAEEHADAPDAGHETIGNAAGQTGEYEGVAEPAELAEPSSQAHEAPLLVVPDSRGRFRRWDMMLAEQYWRAGVALCARSTPQDHLDYLEAAGVDRIVAGQDRVDLARALVQLREQYGVKLVRVDSGGGLNGALLRMGLLDELSLLVHLTLAEAGAVPAFGDVAMDRPGRRPRLTHAEALDGSLVWLRYRVGAPAPGERE